MIGRWGLIDIFTIILCYLFIKKFKRIGNFVMLELFQSTIVFIKVI